MLEIVKAISLTELDKSQKDPQHHGSSSSSGPMTPVRGVPVQSYNLVGGILRAAPPSRTVTPSTPGEQVLAVADPIVEETFEDCVSE